MCTQYIEILALHPPTMSSDRPSDQSFRNMVLGLPREGPKAGTPEAEALQSAEAFIGDIRAEIEEYDRANARAVEETGSRWGLWRAATATTNIPSAGTQQTSDLGNGQFVQRSNTAATAPTMLSRAQQMSRFLRRKRNIHSVPLLQRWWVPVVCVAALGVVWTPDTWKLRGLHYADSMYAALRRWIHTRYWRLTMDPSEFEALMKEIEANIPKNRRGAKSSDCPF